MGFSQQDSYLTIVKLKDGSVLEGKLTEFKDGEFIKMNIGDNLITIKYESIKSIKHKNLDFARSYNFEEKGFYHHSSLGLMPGFLSARNLVLGLEMNHTSGYQFNRWIGAGLNLGINNFNPVSREIFYSLAGEARGYLLAKNISPYYVVKAGYGFINKGSNFIEASGGYFLNPGAGIRFGGSKTANFTAEIGLVFQKAYLKQESGWWDRSILEKRVRYQRFCMKIGMLF